MDLLKENAKLTCKPVITPIDPNHTLGEAEEDVMDKEGINDLKGANLSLTQN